ncbi:insert subdomain of RNA polymerase alpha subunit [Amniculicola lignicola CBS 123094]|uniref:DNA-directed RNA polymerases I and III subunit RPAC1 n=1 Tax=Amniculicola lignicola CBS 123094 TaxID=1392246 RepID=A0A6A5VWL8_9PLEO|nr:insert subdomain of RNA polymerase alpha subunit [Amniculicola lignicola CBS 123094]
MSQPSQEERRRRKLLTIGDERVANTASNDLPSLFPGEDMDFNLHEFKKNFNVQFHTSSAHDSTFSLTGLDTSLANAFRRICISEIPTVAIEDVYIMQNNGVMQDEVLAQRLGLIPLKGSPSGLRWLRWYIKPSPDDPDAFVTPPSDHNVVVMKLNVKCEWREGGLQLAAKGETDPDKLYKNHAVYAKHLKYVPTGKQEEMFKDGPIEAVHPDILITKMRPGQELDLMVHAMKGIGADHAKFSPVATASYRLLPTIDITSPILSAEAKKFARCFPKGVIALAPVTTEQSRKDPALKDHEGELHAVVSDPMRDTVSRECLRHDEFKNKVKLGRVRDHFIFSVESTGQWESDELFLESVRLLKVKAQRVRRGLGELMK